MLPARNFVNTAWKRHGLEIEMLYSTGPLYRDPQYSLSYRLFLATVVDSKTPVFGYKAFLPVHPQKSENGKRIA